MITVIPWPCGKLAIHTHDQQLIGIDLWTSKSKTRIPACPFIRDVITQLRAYLADPQFTFQLPLQLSGTPYQQRVWQALRKIPLGTVKTYGQLATQLNSSPRAIGQACRCNPIPIIIPCHRIVSATSLGGFAGKTAGKRINTKRWLLSHENYLDHRTT